MFTTELASTICERISDGATQRELCSSDDMPGRSTLQRWIRDNEAFRSQYARAMEARADYWAEELLEIADDGRNDWMTRTYGDQEIDVPNPEVIARSKLRIETRKWLMGKAAPKKYGEKVDVTHKGDADAPPVFTIKIDNG